MKTYISERIKSTGSPSVRCNPSYLQIGAQSFYAHWTPPTSLDLDVYVHNKTHLWSGVGVFRRMKIGRALTKYSFPNCVGNGHWANTSKLEIPCSQTWSCNTNSRLDQVMIWEKKYSVWDSESPQQSLECPSGEDRASTIAGRFWKVTWPLHGRS